MKKTKILREKANEGYIIILLFITMNLILVKADFSLITPSDNQVDFLTKTNAQGILIDGKTYYLLENVESLKVKYHTGFISNYLNLKAGSQGNPKLIFQPDGKLIEAYFKTGQEGNYLLGNEQVFLPAGAEINFKEGKAEIKLSSAKELMQPSVLDKNPGETIFEFILDDKKFNLGNGNVFEGKSLKFEKGKWFIDYKGNAKLNSLNIINEGKTYIDFRGENDKNYDSAYISIDDKKGVFVTGSNIDERGPKISFTKDNPYGLKIDNKDHFAVQSLGNSEGAYVKIVNRNPEKIPLMESLNGFAINFDEKSAYYSYEKGKLYFRKEVILQGFQTGKTTSPVEIHAFKGSFDDAQAVSSVNGKPEILGITPGALWGYGTNPYFIKTDVGYKGYPSLKTGFSNSWVYYNIKTTANFNRFFRGRAHLIGEYDPSHLKILTDMLGNLPTGYWKRVGKVEIDGRGAGWAYGLASSKSVWLDNIYDPGLVFHELGHTHTFEIEDELFPFWNSVSSYRGGYVTGYARTNNYEDIAETTSMVYEPQWWKKNKLLTSDVYSPVYRGKLAVLRKFGMISEEKFTALGLDPNKVNDYITEAQYFTGSRKRAK